MSFLTYGFKFLRCGLACYFGLNSGFGFVYFWSDAVIVDFFWVFYHTEYGVMFGIVCLDDLLQSVLL